MARRQHFQTVGKGVHGCAMGPARSRAHLGHYGEKTPDVTLERISKDGVELAAYLCRELHKNKIVVLGHSWGSLVAVHMVQLRPELFAAYVGTGQVSSWAANVNTQFDLHLAKARREGDQAQIKKLAAIGRPDPTDTKQYFGLGSLISIMAPSDQAWIKHLHAQFPELKAREPEQAQNLNDGMMFTAERVLPDQVATDLPKTACDMHTAFFCHRWPGRPRRPDLGRRRLLQLRQGTEERTGPDPERRPLCVDDCSRPVPGGPGFKGPTSCDCARRNSVLGANKQDMAVLLRTAQCTKTTKIGERSESGGLV
jgi:pimeloyl-ACP methyl ester carboxylesterase